MAKTKIKVKAGGKSNRSFTNVLSRKHTFNKPVLTDHTISMMSKLKCKENLRKDSFQQSLSGQESPMTTIKTLTSIKPSALDAGKLK